MSFIGRNVTPYTLTHNLQDGDVRHGLSDGTWSLIDLLGATARITGPSTHLDLAVWTASGDHGARLDSLLRSGALASVRLIVDRSFQSRQPKNCATVRRLFGDDALRVWSCHAKFAVFTGGEFDVLCMFSANLNKNKRIENFTLWADSTMCAEYLTMLADAWQAQRPGEGFDVARAGRKLSDTITGPVTAGKDLNLPDFDPAI